jgi:hypothetical protein
MKAKLVQSWQLEDELDGIMTLTGARALALAAYRHKGYFLECEGQEPLDLAGESPLFRKGGAGFDPIDRDYRGTLFFTPGHWGIVYADVVHLISSGDGTVRSMPIENPFQPDRQKRNQAPLRARALPGTKNIAVVLNSFGDVGAAEQLATLSLGETSARWLAPPGTLDPGDFPGLSEVDKEIYDGGRYDPFITALGTDDGGNLMVHSSGPMRNFGRYGMAYSVLARLNGARRSQVIAAVEPGTGAFASDGQSFLLYRLRGKPTLDIYDLKGALKDTVRLSPAVLGGRKNFDGRPDIDLVGDDLWVADPFDGYVCHIKLE